jgi:hypothetical protein
VELVDRLLQRTRRQARDDLRALGGPHVVDLEEATVVAGFAGGDERQLIAVVQTSHRERFL